MFKTGFLYLLLCCWAVLPLQAQQNQPQKYRIQELAKGPLKSIRGMSVVSGEVIWVSGTDGIVGRSTDGGRSWNWAGVPGCDSCDWRDIVAFNNKEALVINAGEPAHIFRTADGGLTWEQVYFNDTKGIFFDGMEFPHSGAGWAIGDPLDGRFTLIHTPDGGRHWTQDVTAPTACRGEAIFAASGTSLQALLPGGGCFVTGGDTARFLKYQDKRWLAFALPILQGSSSTGAFSVAFWTPEQGVVVGGDYRNDTLRRQNCVLTSDGGKTWTYPLVPPGGFRSCVTRIRSNMLVATGTSGTDISTDGGLHWQLISKEGFHVVQSDRRGKAVFLAGSNGRIARLLGY